MTGKAKKIALVALYFALAFGAVYAYRLLRDNLRIEFVRTDQA